MVEDRSTTTGQMINGYLTGKAQQDDHAIHLLFSANRWEAVQSILQSLASGTTIIIDRYSFSGAVYSAAKDNPNLDLKWAWSPEIGLPQPDLVYFLDISSADAAKRGGYGEERYETQKMQARVRTLFNELFSFLPVLNLHRIDAGGSLDEVADSIVATFSNFSRSIENDKPPSKLAALAL